MNAKLIFKRIFSWYIDMVIIVILLYLVLFISVGFDIEKFLRPQIENISLAVLLLGFLCIPLLKDVIFGGISLGKRLLKLKIICINENERLTFAKLILRNTTFYLFSIDFICLLITKKFSLGDKISKTTVVDH